jgi:hypothetical protein
MMTAVNGLELPSIILALIAAGRWQKPTDPALLRRFFYDFGEPGGISGPKLFLPPQMQFETNGMLKEVRAWCLKPDPHILPGDIEPTKTVLIGDTGIGWDAPIALDYGKTPDDPSVLWFFWPPPDDNNRRRPCRWVEIAPTAASFAETLEL